MQLVYNFIGEHNFTTEVMPELFFRVTQAYCITVFPAWSRFLPLHQHMMPCILLPLIIWWHQNY